MDKERESNARAEAFIVGAIKAGLLRVDPTLRLEGLGMDELRAVASQRQDLARAFFLALATAERLIALVGDRNTFHRLLDAGEDQRTAMLGELKVQAQAEAWLMRQAERQQARPI